MGDGLLAIFPLGDGDDAAQARRSRARRRARKRSARSMARREGGARAAASASRSTSASSPTATSAASNRLDFTAIGPAVNLAARLEGLDGKLGRTLVVSRGDRAPHHARDRRARRFDLKGVPAPVHVYAPWLERRMSRVAPMMAVPALRSRRQRISTT